MTEPVFITQGRAYARPESSRPTELDRIREESVLSFVATWEALHVVPAPGDPAMDRKGLQLIGRWAELEFQTAFLRRLATF